MDSPQWEYRAYDAPETEPLPLYGVPELDDRMHAVGLGARAHLRTSSVVEGRSSLHIDIEEFLVLSNGLRMTVRTDRGLGIGWNFDGSDVSERELREQIALALLPDEVEVEDVGEPMSWHELARLVTELGIPVTPEMLRELPFEIELTPGLLVVPPSEG